MRKGILAGMAVVTIAIGAGFVFLLTDGGLPRRGDSTILVDGSKSDDPRKQSALGSTAIPVPRQSPPLPPLDAPLSLIVDDLRERAAKGEAAASCRLAAEYAYCGQLSYRRAEMDRWLSERERALVLISSPDAKRGAAKSIEREMALRQTRVDELSNHCSGATIPTASEVARTWRSSALAGNPAAMKQYASGNVFRMNSMLDALPELAIYKQEAERVATVAAKRGDFDMLLLLAAGYSPSQTASRPLLAQALEPDLARSLALYRHARDQLKRSGHESERISYEVEDRIRSLEAGLSAQEATRAAQIGSELQRWDPPVIRGAHRLDTAGRQRDVDRGWCSR